MICIILYLKRFSFYKSEQYTLSLLKNITVSVIFIYDVYNISNRSFTKIFLSKKILKLLIVTDILI